MINLDETSVAYSFIGSRGNIVKKRWWQNPLHRLCHKVPRSELRGAVSHLALITENSEVKARLPQIFIGNRNRFTLTSLAVIADSKPASVHLWREVSAWNSTKHMLKMLELLADSLLPFLNAFQPILIMDCAPCHLHASIVNRAAALGIWVVYVPARLTWLLQPLDVSTFSAYKAFLRKTYNESSQSSGQVSKEDWFKMLFAVSTKFLCGRRWTGAFVTTGCAGDRTQLSKDLRSVGIVSRAAPSVLPLPSEHAVQSLMPRNKASIPYWALFRGPSGRRRLILIWRH